MLKTANHVRAAGDELRTELKRLLSDYFGTKCQIRRMRRRHSIYSSSFNIENVEVEFEHGKPVSMIFKDLSPSSLLEAARNVRPQFLYNPRREIEIYQRLLDPLECGTPICYGAVHDPARERSWLFLERVQGPLLWQVGRLETWQRAATWLAWLHRHFAANRWEAEAWPSLLLRYDISHFKCWIERAEKFVGQRPDACGNGLTKAFTRLSDHYGKVVERLMSLPRSFIHGEFYPSNVILRGKGSSRRVCAIDWEVAGIGPGLMDVAALASGTWTTEERTALVSAYREALEPIRGWPPSLKDLLELVDYCQLQLAVQWLGWSSDWSPPKSHAQDWLREAVRLAKKLGL